MTVKKFICHKYADSSRSETSEVFMSESLNNSFKPLFHNCNITVGILYIYIRGG